jgi:hypothetical protein
MDSQLPLSYWENKYDKDQKDNEKYFESLGDCPFGKRLGQLWVWKGLNHKRGYSDEEMAEYISKKFEGISGTKYTPVNKDEASQERIDLLEKARGDLKQKGLLKEDSSATVSPAFVLHVANSTPEQYSRIFPIYDKRVWNAYEYLSGDNPTDDNILNSEASVSDKRYSEYCDWFSATCPEESGAEETSVARRYEKALFAFGKWIRKRPTENNRPSYREISNALSQIDKENRPSSN